MTDRDRKQIRAHVLMARAYDAYAEATEADMTRGVEDRASDAASFRRLAGEYRLMARKRAERSAGSEGTQAQG
jgi:hypothetical protein